MKKIDQTATLLYMLCKTKQDHSKYAQFTIARPDFSRQALEYRDISKFSQFYGSAITFPTISRPLCIGTRSLRRLCQCRPEESKGILLRSLPTLALALLRKAQKECLCYQRQCSTVDFLNFSYWIVQSYTSTMRR